MNGLWIRWGGRLLLLAALLLLPGTGWAMGAAEYNAAGMDFIRQGEYIQAVAEFGKAIAVDPDYAKAYNNRGGAYVALQLYPEALADFNRALELNPQYAKGYNNRAYVLVQLGQYDAALADVSQALAIGPAEATYYDTRGAAYAGKKLYPAALADFSQALQLDPDLAEVYVHRAQVYMDTGRWNGALQDYNTYISQARSEGSDPLRDLAMRRCNEICRMLPELEARDEARLGLDTNIIAGRANSVVWDLSGKNLTLRHFLDYSAGAGIKVGYETVKRYGDYTLIQIYEKSEGDLEPAPGRYIVETSLKLTDPGKYIVQLWGVARYVSPLQSAQLIAEQEFNVE